MKSILSAIGCLILSLVVNGQDLSQFGIREGTERSGLEVGTTAPVFEAEDQNGNKLDLEAALQKRPVILIFYRGHWCPKCNRHLSNVTDSLYLLNEKATVWFVTPEKPENVAKTDEKYGGKLTLISDRDGSLMEAYQVSFEVTEAYNKAIEKYFGETVAGFNGQEAPRLPVPATYVIGTDGKIIYRQFDYDYGNRSSVETLYHLL